MPAEAPSVPSPRRLSPGCSFVLAVLLLPLMLVVRSVGVESFHIPSGSMEPTLRIGDRVLASKSAYALHLPFTRIALTARQQPRRGDIVVFFAPGSRDPSSWTAQVDFPPVFPSDDYVKRVVGLPGDTVSVVDGRAVVNGHQQGGAERGAYRFVDHRCAPMKTRRRTEELGDHRFVVLQAESVHRRMPDWGPKKVPRGKVFVLGDNRDRSKDSRAFGFVPIDHIKARAIGIGLSIPVCTASDALPEPRWKRIGTGVNGCTSC
jgi:signal peptidase I